MSRYPFRPVVSRYTTTDLPRAMEYAREAASTGWFVTVLTSTDDFTVVVSF